MRKEREREREIQTDRKRAHEHKSVLISCGLLDIFTILNKYEAKLKS
jgi:hypothetical protein